MKAKASISIKMLSTEHLLSLLKAIGPELKKSGNRSKVKLDREGSLLTLSVEAKDTIALRATLNTYLRWISSTIEALEVITKRKSSK
jgi:tRNA threonylcarbamoyladenosine modification (KEOPS) complex  Pcc1 subunit